MNKYQDSIISDISRLVKIPSVYQESDSYLFGEAIDHCLDEALSIMKELGYSTFKAEDGAYGYAEIGEGETFAVLAHLDVVNARVEDGWEHDPFDPMIKDGYLCGRGVQDDKGPLMICAYALKALLDEGYELKHKVRFILGLDEETLWRSINIYCEREAAPMAGFVPDAAFPLTYAEKGLLQVIIKDKNKSSIKYHGGDSFNAVSSFAKTKRDPKIEEALNTLGYEFELDGDMIHVKGITAHAKNPWKGISANLHLLEAMKLAGYESNAINFACDCLNNKFEFEGFSETDLSDFSGPVSINLGKMIGDEETIFSVDLRLPPSQTKEGILKLLRCKANEYNMEVEEFDYLRPIHVPLDSELVKSLLGAYRDVSGDVESHPYLTAGATYARAFDNCVAFGANFPGLLTTEHQPNEKVKIEQMMLSAQIYKEALKRCVMK
ncbi:MAG: Sapep family Mn(2+)-dependent dipeptidase [Erysipelotrichaceae bacterium]